MTHAVICEVVAALMKGPRTKPELAEMVDAKRQALASAIDSLRWSGLMRIADWRRHPRLACGDLSDRFDAVYELQQPFAAEDVPRPSTKCQRRHARLRALRQERCAEPEQRSIA